MGLKASDFNASALRGKEIVSMRIDTANESTVTVVNKKGKTERHRLPIGIVNLLEFYRTNA